MIAQSIGVFLCLILCIAAGVGILWARNEDRADLHRAHIPGTCEWCDQ